MRNCRITVMRKAFYKDLAEKYENPIEHACNMQEGQIFITDGWNKPEGMCDSAWETLNKKYRKSNTNKCQNSDNEGENDTKN